MIEQHYKTLGIPTGSSIKEVKKAYRFLASKYHPDKHNGDSFFADKFKEVEQAYSAIIKSKLKEHVEEVAVDLEVKPKIRTVRYSPPEQTYQPPPYQDKTAPLNSDKNLWTTPIQNKGCRVIIYAIWIILGLLFLIILI